ncbi:MAG: hypothetical protein P9M14_10265 [Candidatus Alcyoniella australis]|nr:hypothetical protein [Candidatus Alcyoniella australis]
MNRHFPGAGLNEDQQDGSTGIVASELYCPRCKAAMPVRERLLLYLLNQELHEYTCARCGTSLGKRTIPTKPPHTLYTR